jgi:hypothetical protein
MKHSSKWLLTLNISSERKKLICFLDATMTNEFVATFLENLLPIVADDTWEEKAKIGNRFEAKWFENNPNLIICGIGNPLLIAQKVENIIVDIDEKEQETLEFTSLATQKNLRYNKSKDSDLLFQYL